MSSISTFNPHQISVIDHNGSKWLTAEQLGLALGFSAKRARDGVNNLYNRHIEEFSDDDSTTIKLMAIDGKLRETRIFSHSGCNLVSFFANTPNAKAFRAWAKEKLVEHIASGYLQPNELIEELQDEYCRARPDMLKLLVYYNKGLTHQEMGKLLDLSPDSIRYRLKTLSRLGLVDYAPAERYIRAGKLGNAAMRQKQALPDVQQSLALEG
ncbi:MAG: BRO family protein [Alysiella sp.]|uniref:BRO family protein n=1 Tax=Alysiella sp. TaxID=1872483 RepID=UPI0026DB1EF3|nr:BRO family protein [Alysiella sp.]MDO4434576.1 BRO family protein [Alysiella sp.]